jgi:hypothetical protein
MQRVHLKGGEMISEAAEVFELERPTPEQVRQRAALAAQVKRIETQEIPHPDVFKLTGSNRAADDVTQWSLF